MSCFEEIYRRCGCEWGKDNLPAKLCPQHSWCIQRAAEIVAEERIKQLTQELESLRTILKERSQCK